MKIRNYYLQKNDVEYMNIKKNLLVSRRILKIVFDFHYNIQEDSMLGIGYVDVRRIPCSYYELLST